MIDLSRYNPTTRTYTGTSGIDEITINDLANFYPGETGFVVNGGAGGDTISSWVDFASRSDVINGEDGDDVLRTSTAGVSGGRVWLDGGRGMDYAFIYDAINMPDFRVGNQAIEFNLQTASGSMAVRVYYSTEVISIGLNDNLDRINFLTEDISRGRIREVTDQEVIDRTSGDNADWFVNGLDTFEFAIDGGVGFTGAITSSTAGVFEEGVTLIADEVFDDPDGLPSDPSYEYQWFRNGVAIAGATERTYFVPARGAGSYGVDVTYTDLINYRGPVRPSDRIVTAINNGIGTVGSISSSVVGIFREGVTLTAAAVTGDPDGMPSNPNYAYQWYRNGSAIPGATGKLYAVPIGGAGTYRVGVTYLDQQGFRATVSSPNQVVGKILTGTPGGDNLVGTIGSDLITGLAGADRLSGGGAADTFRYTTFTESRLIAYDRITDFVIGTDQIDGPIPVGSANIAVMGRALALTQKGINQLFGKSSFKASRAATFTLGSGSSVRTFIALNDRTIGFDASRDALIEITGYSGNLSKMAII